MHDVEVTISKFVILTKNTKNWFVLMKISASHKRGRFNNLLRGHSGCLNASKTSGKLVLHMSGGDSIISCVATLGAQMLITQQASECFTSAGEIQ